MDTITIHFDGGCRPTNPGNKYGSYEIQLNGEKLWAVHRQELGKGTNNEAEFEILLVALHWTLANLQDYGYAPANYRLELFTDSTIVRNRISRRKVSNKTEPEQRMHSLAMRCLALIVLFGGYSIAWQPRESNVVRFGH